MIISGPLELAKLRPGTSKDPILIILK